MLKNLRLIIGLSVALVGIALLCIYFLRVPTPEISRTQVKAIIAQNRVLEAKVNPTPFANIYEIKGIFTNQLGLKTDFAITTHLEESEAKALFANPGVSIAVPGKSKAQIVNIVSTVVIGGLVIGLLAVQMNVGRTHRTQKIRQRPTTRFDDVAGVEEAKSEVQEVVDFLRDPKKYKVLGGKLPKGVLLVGPPGTGKTMLARAIAGEANANFFSAQGSDFNEVFVGVGAKRVRELFRQAAKHKPAIIFIDEIDCLGKSRKMDSHGELQQTNNALLAAMDGFESSDGIVVVAATNRPEDLDEALTRPGRFDRKVHVPLPDARGRRAILKTHAQEKPIDDREVVLDLIAQTTPDMSGADLASVLNEAAILCAQKNQRSITLPDLEESRDKVRWGKERKSMVVKKGEREMVAYHEAGHALINLQMPLLPTLYKVSIIPRGQALGVTTLLPNEDQNIHSKEFLLQELVVLMGGRAAEKTFYGCTTNGANGDLNSAKNIARRMIYDWGMGEKLYYEPEKNEAEREINRLLEAADREALEIVESRREQADQLAKALLTRETLTRQEVLDLWAENQAKPAPVHFETDQQSKIGFMLA